jgi:hypothetical protein
MLLVAFLATISFSAEYYPAAACSLSESCGEMWVAAQDVGKEIAFFEKDDRSLKAAEVQIGNVLTANRDINVRSRPANWRNSLFTLKKGQPVVVAELRTLSISGGRTQLWIRIEAPPNQQAGASCNLSPIVRPPLRNTVALQPGLATNIVLSRRVSMQQKRTDDGTKYIEFNENGELKMQPDVLGRIMAQAISTMRSHAGETCQFSISTFGGSANWAVPPGFHIDADGKGRKCTSFDLPCGLPEEHCEIRWDFQKCETHTPMCTQRQVFDIGDWSMSVAGTLPISIGSDSNTIVINATRGAPNIDTGGSGEIADILNHVGLLKIFQNIDTSLRVDVNFDVIPSFGRLLSINAPTEAVASSRKLVGADWVQIRDTEAGQFSGVGIGYTQFFSLPESTGCLAAGCFRKSVTDEDFAKCILGTD